MSVVLQDPDIESPCSYMTIGMSIPGVGHSRLEDGVILQTVAV